MTDRQPGLPMAPAATATPRSRSGGTAAGSDNTACSRPAPRFTVIRVPDLPIWVWRRLDPGLGAGEIAIIDQDRVVCCTSYLRQLGVIPGWSAERVRTLGKREGVTLALRAWPGLHLDLVWEDLLHELNGLTPTLEAHAPGLIVTHLLDDAQAAAVARELLVAIGVAADRMTAHVAALAAEAGSAVTVATGAEQSFRNNQSIACLVHDGVDDETRQRLAWLGLTTIGSMTRLSLAQLSARFACGDRLFELSRDGSTRPVALYHPPPTLTATLTPNEPWRDCRAAEFSLRQLLEQCIAGLHGRLAGQITLAIHTDIGVRRVRRWLREPSADSKRLLVVTRRLWREALPDDDVKAMPRVQRQVGSEKTRHQTNPSASPQSVVIEPQVTGSGPTQPTEIAQIRLLLSGLRWPSFGQSTLFAGRGPSRLQSVLGQLATRFPGKVQRIELVDPDGVLPEESFRLVDAAAPAQARTATKADTSGRVVPAKTSASNTKDNAARPPGPVRSPGKTPS